MSSEKPESLLIEFRTIHGMVYNAMKLFMEVNPTLFDECSSAYAEENNTVNERKQAREMRWERLKAMAQQNQAGNPLLSAQKVPPASGPVGDYGHVKAFENLTIQDGPAPARGVSR